MEHFRIVAKQIKNKLDEGHYSFITIDYNELLSLYRQATGYDARLGKNTREGLIEALSQEGIQVFPSIDDCEGESVRFFRSGTILWDIVFNLRYPSRASDNRLATLITKIKEDPTIEIRISTE